MRRWEKKGGRGKIPHSIVYHKILENALPILSGRGGVAPAGSDVRCVSGNESDCAAQLGVRDFLLAQSFFQVLLRSQRDSGLHFLCREKVTKSGRGAPRTPVQGDSHPAGDDGPARPLFAAESEPPLAPG